MKKTWKKVLFILLIFLIICIVGAIFMFDKNDYKNDYEKDNYSALSSIEKLISAGKSGKTVELTSEDINNIFSIIYKDKKQIGSVIVNTPEAFLEGNYVGFKIPVVYKNKEIILTSKGKVSLENGNVLYKAEYFKIGKVRVPKKIVFDKLKDFSRKGISLTNGNIKIDKKNIPFFIEGLSVKDSTLNIDIKTLSKK